MRFRYVAYNVKRGSVEGTLEAGSEAEARAAVARQGYKPLHLSPAWRPPRLEHLFPSLFGVSTEEMITLSRQLATMLGSGAGLLRTLEMLQRESRNALLRETLEAIHKKLDEGGSFSSALAKHPRVFGPLFVTVVEVGEHTGRLGPALDQMADIMEKAHEAKMKAMRTMMYPVAIIGLSLITLGVLVMVALPPLLNIFSQMGAEVPLMTRIVVGAVRGMSQHWLQLLLGAVVAATAFGLLVRVPRVKFWLDAAKSQAPVFGPLLVAGELARFSRTITMLLEAGVPLATALRLSMGGCRNAVLSRAFADAEESLLTGHSVAEALKRHPVIPTMFVELMMIGEESNSLRRVMTDAANAYQTQTERRLNSLLSLMEPVSTVVVAGIVGLIAFSMFMPIYSGMNAIR